MQRIFFCVAFFVPLLVICSLPVIASSSVSNFYADVYIRIWDASGKTLFGIYHLHEWILIDFNYYNPYNQRYEVGVGTRLLYEVLVGSLNSTDRQSYIKSVTYVMFYQAGMMGVEYAPYTLHVNWLNVMDRRDKPFEAGMTMWPAQPVRMVLRFQWFAVSFSNGQTYNYTMPIAAFETWVDSPGEDCNITRVFDIYTIPAFTPPETGEVAQLKGTIHFLNNVTNHLMGIIQQWRDKAESLNQTLQSLQSAYDSLTARHNQLQADYSRLKEEADRLKDETVQLSATIEQLQQENKAKSEALQQQTLTAYMLAAATAVLLITTIYFSRKSRWKA